MLTVKRRFLRLEQQTFERMLVRHQQLIGKLQFFILQNDILCRRAGQSQMRGWPGVARWAAYLALDFFGSFCIKTKRT
jgi:hypothetical protein